VAQANQDLKNLVKRYELVVEAPVEADMQFHDTIEEGFIISTTPAAGEPLKKGDTIRFVVSKGKELKPVPVPNFVSQQISNILPQLESVWKLKCSDADISMEDSDQPGGTIIWQSIPANTTAMEGDTIQFKVSSGLSSLPVTFDVPLPDDGRKTVYVEVYVGDEQTPQYAETVNCKDNRYTTVTVRGSGLQQIMVYYDGVVEQRLTHTMQLS